MAPVSPSAPQPDGRSRSFLGVTVTDDKASGQITQGTLGDWEASDWFDPDVWAAIQWYNLPQEERERAERLEQAMRRASLSNPLAY